MSKKDNIKVNKYDLLAYEWQTDLKLPKNIRKSKRKERQSAKKIIAKERKNLGK
jgi:hypothetical protein